MLLFDLLMHSHKLKKEQTGLIFSHQSLTQFTSYEKRKAGVLIVELGYWSVFTPLFDVKGDDTSNPWSKQTSINSGSSAECKNKFSEDCC